VRYVIVAFRHDRENSVHYAKCGSLNELIDNLRVAVERKHANIISIRVVADATSEKRDKSSELLNNMVSSGKASEG